MQRIGLLASAARRAKAINTAFGTHLTLDEINRTFADDDIDLLIAWQEHTTHAE